MIIHIEKFPEIEFQGRRVIWDTRQISNGKPEWVLCPQDAYSSLDLEEELRKRPGCKVIGSLKSGADLAVSSPRDFLGYLAANQFGNPSQKLFVAGVTGTNGKTTSVCLLSALLQSGEYRVAEIGTLGLRIFENGKLLYALETGFTTPDAPMLQHLFAELIKNKVTHIVMEVSSHALTLGRVAGIDFDGGIFTNLTQDHLDFHKSMNEYEEAKQKFFCFYMNPKALKNGAGEIPLSVSKKKAVAVINVDDVAGARFLAKVPADLGAFGFSKSKSYQILQMGIHGMKLNCRGIEINSPLVGDYNAENLIGAFELVSRATNISEAKLVAALARFGGAPGRLEKVSLSGAMQNRERHVFVDYAHTPDALEKVLKTLRSLLQAPARLMLVFGCGGDRDAAKRPIMGAIGEKWADRVYVTSDNPRTEDPQKILQDIKSGMKGAPYFLHPDRKQCIETCLEDMTRDDVLLVAGKGHESYQIIGKDKIPYSDFAVVAQWFTKST